MLESEISGNLVEGALIQVGAFDQLERIQKSGGALLGVVGLDRRRLTDSVTDQAMKGIFVDEAQKAVRKHAMGSLADGVEIVAAKLGDDAGAMGAAALAKDYVESKG